MRSKSVWIVGVALAMQLGCVGGSKGLTAEEKEKLKPYILESAPTDIPHKVDINFENKVHIIGYKFDPELARPGTEVKLTYYWRCDDTLDDGWGLFTHLRDDVADKTDNLDGSGALRETKNNKQIMGPDRWEKGKFYVDEQTYKMPDWLKGPELTVFVGVWKVGTDGRLKIVSGPNDGENRAIVGKVKTGLTAQSDQAHSSNDLPQLTVNKLAANDKIVIDGKGDDGPWGGAASTGPFVDVVTGKPNTSFPVNGSAKMAWDDTNLYLLIEVSDPDVVGYFTSRDKQPNDWTVTGQPKLWTKDTVEMMLEPDADGTNTNYYELQINPQNKMFHSQYDGYNTPKTEPNGPFGHEDWDPKLKSAVVVRGSLDKPGDKDSGYTVEAAIPWASYSKAQNHPPKPGETWRVNFYAMKQNAGPAWSPILGQGNFHKASRFGRVTWSVPGMAVPAAASGAATPAIVAAPPGSGGMAGPGVMRPPFRMGIRGGAGGAVPAQPPQPPPPP
jgi:hypothetical protein